ncbi:MAG: hypothetical protein ACLU37_06250 [Collinsella sp.]
MAASWAALLVGVVEGLSGSRAAACASPRRSRAWAINQSASSGFLGSAGPCRYVPMTPL